MTFEVIDKYGKRVRRDGVAQDGDTVVTKMQMMDGMPPEFHAAVSLADSVKRNEQFDARGHRPGFIGKPDDTSARDAYFARTRDAWRNPPAMSDGDKARLPITPTSPTADVEAARAQARADREQRTRDAWKAA
ncbi:hypothetical protein JQ620_15330 [Bradyrhizobium sp. AUGA SZCCT0274]|uniref:hypothetical protein n=1 Tax=Bradyrhizobium sp. AUGA SZCCT0274 TaxID=2807670 RepID=UPI001BABA540|nr:hypothetical protein [Bradyrhizobium sp. AUGA SZCCT0274]MBR1241501.1 hypothetical protein [Bradyrhizobium sp. AUGA SZCCT0274]